MSPLVRALLVAFLTEVRDTFCDIWFTFRPERNEFWDTVPYAYRPDRLPAPVNADTVAAGQPGTAVTPPGPPSPASNPRWRPWRREYLLRICRTDRGGCGAHIGASCVTADGKVTAPHKPRLQP